MRPTVLFPQPIMPTRYTLVPPSPAAARSAAACGQPHLSWRAGAGLQTNALLLMHQLFLSNFRRSAPLELCRQQIQVMSVGIGTGRGMHLDAVGEVVIGDVVCAPGELLGLGRTGDLAAGPPAIR